MDIAVSLCRAIVEKMLSGAAQMGKYPKVKTVVSFIVVVVLVTGLSIISVHIWGGKPEEAIHIEELKIDDEMTLREFGQANDLPNNVLKELFDLKSPSDLGKRLDEYGTAEQITVMATRKLALTSEAASKNWVKIPLKFGLWFIFLPGVFLYCRKRKVTSVTRKGLLCASVLIFGIIMGADPSPMGTVKDAIHLYGTAQAIFPPRMIALMIFLALVFLANKYICAWGCQVGTLQDMIFRINQTDKHKTIIGKKIVLPFTFTNTVRIVFLVLFTLVALSWGSDIVEPIDPFKVYKPMYLGLGGMIFIGLLLVASLFMYRPWCHLFCPFGLVGWLVEKVSRVRVSVDYDTCIACGKCAEACPSTVMSAILKQDKKVIPDCFACYTCRDVCPTGSIRFSTRKRTVPPMDHFKKGKKA